MEIKHERQNLLQIGALIMINIYLIISLFEKFADSNISDIHKLVFTILTITSFLLAVTMISQFLKRVQSLVIKNDVFIIKNISGKQEFGKNELTFWKESMPLPKNPTIRELVLDFRGKQFVLRSPNYKEYKNLINFLNTHYQDKILKIE
jgi:hypothetical protein